MYMSAQIQLKTVKTVEIEPESDVHRQRLPVVPAVYTPASLHVAGQPEVGDLGLAGGVDQHVPARQVAVHELARREVP